MLKCLRTKNFGKCVISKLWAEIDKKALYYFYQALD